MQKIYLPNFMLVGALKCGTTSLYHYLNEHPQIYMPKIKEPRFFISPALLKKENFDNKFLRHNFSVDVNNFEDYKSLYLNVKNEIAVGEASPQYLYTYETTIPLIKKYLGDIKIIIILRNPIDRAFSAYKHKRRYTAFTKRFNEELSFIKALKIEDERIKTGYYSLLFYYKTMGFYYDQVKSYKDNFSNVLVCDFEELNNDPISVMKIIYNFLEVDHNFKPNIKVKYNIARSNKPSLIHKAFLNLNSRTRMKIMRNIGKLIGNDNLSKIVNLLVKKDESKPDEYSRNYLINEFNEDIIKLEELINKDLHNWLK